MSNQKKRWMWCDRCLHYVWTDGTECPVRHFSTLTYQKPEPVTVPRLTAAEHNAFPKGRW